MRPAPGSIVGPSLFKSADARRLWYASACIAAAMWMLHITIALYVLSAADTAALAAVQLTGAMPTLLLMPIAGWAADRFRVHRLARVGVAAQMFATLGIALFAALGSVPALAVMFAVQGMAMAFWAPSRQHWLYGVIEPDLRQRANAAMGSLNGAMIIVGAVGAGVASILSPVLGICVASTLLALALAQLLRVRAHEASEYAQVDTDSRGFARHLRRFASELRDGFTATRRFPLAQSVIWIGIAWGFIGGGYTVMINGHVVENLDGESIAVAVVFTVDGLAVLGATVFAGRLRRSLHLRVWAICYVVQGLGWAAFFLAPNLSTALACLVVMRVASGFIIGLDTTILLETVPAEYRGRVTSVHVTTYNAVARLSLAALGAALAVASLVWLGVAAGLASTLFGVVWWLTSGRRAGPSYIEAADSHSPSAVRA